MAVLVCVFDQRLAFHEAEPANHLHRVGAPGEGEVEDDFKSKEKLCMSDRKEYKILSTPMSPGLTLCSPSQLARSSDLLSLF